MVIQLSSQIRVFLVWRYNLKVETRTGSVLFWYVYGIYYIKTLGETWWAFVKQNILVCYDVFSELILHYGSKMKFQTFLELGAAYYVV